MRIIINLSVSLLKGNLILKTFLLLILRKFGDWTNNYPRKLFNYKLANDIFYENLDECLNCCNHFLDFTFKSIINYFIFLFKCIYDKITKLIFGDRTFGI